MRFNLAEIARRARNPRRKSVKLRPILPPGTLASNLYAEAYAPVVAAWESALSDLLEEYRRSLASVTQDSPADLGRVLDRTDGALTRLFVVLRPALQRLVLRTERWHRGKWRGAVLSATGVDLQTMIGAEEVRDTLEAAIERNVGLIRSVSDQARSRITDAVFRGLNQRRAADEVAKEIREAVAMSRRRARNIASDQIVKISSALDQERRREAGIEKWEWRHSGKAHPREEHEARDGEVYSDKQPPADMPGELPFCGCASRAVLEFE